MTKIEQYRNAIEKIESHAYNTNDNTIYLDELFQEELTLLKECVDIIKTNVMTGIWY